jgi:hypothetical protein
MKKIIIGLCVVTTTLMGAASAYSMPVAGGTPVNNVNVPVKVKSAFHHEYKDATSPVWAIKNGKWDVSFRKDGTTDMTACYNWSGHRIDSRMPIAQSAVPSRVIDKLKDKYPGEYAHNFTKIDRPWKMNLYMVKVDEKGARKSLYLDKYGHEHDYTSR